MILMIVEDIDGNEIVGISSVFYLYWLKKKNYFSGMY